MSFTNTFAFNAETVAVGTQGSTWNFRLLNPEGLSGKHNHIRQLVLKVSGTVTMGATAGSATLKPDLAFGNVNLTIPGSPKDPISLPLSAISQIHRLEHAGNVPSNAYFDGAAASDLHDGHTFSATGNDTHTISVEYPLSWSRPYSASPDDFILPVTAFQGASMSVQFNGASGMLATGAGGVAVSSFSGTIQLIAVMVPLSQVNVPSWTCWVADQIANNTVAPTALTTFDGLTVASGLGLYTPSANMNSSDLTQIGYQIGNYTRTQNGVSSTVWYDEFNAAAETAFLPHTLISSGNFRSQTIPFVFAGKRVGGQTMSTDAEVASGQVKPVFDAASHGPYALFRRVQLAHSYQGNAFSKVKQLAGISAAAKGAVQLAKGASSTSNSRVAATAPYRFSK